MKISYLLFVFIIFSMAFLRAEDGYRLWLRYDLITDNQILNDYKSNISGIISNDTFCYFKNSV